MSSLKSTPRRIVTNLFFALNLPAIPPHASLPFPSRPEGAEAPSPWHRPGYSCPHAWHPVGAKALYGDRTSGFASQSILELVMEFC